MTKHLKNGQTNTELSVFLRKRMAELDINQVQLSKLTGLSPCGINLILNKGSVPQAKTMLKLAPALKVQVEHLYRLAGMIPATQVGADLGNDLQILEYFFSKLSPERQQIAVGLVKSLVMVDPPGYPVDNLLKEEAIPT